MKNKAQIQTLETIAVLFIFFVLVAIGLVFYAVVLRGNIEQQKEEGMELTSIQVAQRAYSLPELQCSEDNIVSDNCIDILKLESASKIIPDNGIYYYDRLLFSTITIDEVYPGDGNWILYDRPLDEFSSRISTQIPISLFDPVTKENYFGVMNVELYIR